MYKRLATFSFLRHDSFFHLAVIIFCLKISITSVYTKREREREREREGEEMVIALRQKHFSLSRSFLHKSPFAAILIIPEAFIGSA